ncbi:MULTISPECIES: preprotein translocase subunit SecE [Janibacter]|uniref:Protein translocase subunit SecE n=1 Tax=Janibacter melonis TaxID=262209 RepID=A0A176Q9Q5_9MICO|nr:preprotein translocase subunit SecE [Janibacter melonis]MBD5829261.1 preprotein translocase subunit SecE [Janibacter melonis]MCB5991088.1 preprotein translocase subunit SecE [Janibacter melonis]OAB86389.1 preprotein translocase subunit SecE [Janibacter melonis]QFQ30882.1 preprotein translocase subunit SecE [Janibacter melonis]
MTELGAQPSKARRQEPKGGNPVSRFFGSIGLFITQVLDELRKVVRPTRSELVNYTLVVIVFVTVMMLFVSLVDFGFTRLVMWVFGG